MRWVVVFLLSGCSSILGIENFTVGDANPMDGDGGETGYCLGQTGWRVCVPVEPTNVPTPIADLAFSTGANGGGTPMPSALCSNTQLWASAGQPEACFIVAKQITIGMNVTVTGQRPLVIFASDTITITGQLDVASHTTAPQPSVGPGSPSSRCLIPTAPISANAGGGGAGGSFINKGGDGGNGTGAARGVAATADSQAPVILRGGCSGGKGGNAGAELGGIGGSGGGAIYLVARNRITVAGYINASGGAGKGGGRSAGGGGGGSGGMIVLIADSIMGNGGVLVANGAGAGGGGGGNQFGTGGSDPVPQMPSMIPIGGSSPVAATGGNGTAGVTTATSGSDAPATAVGGGGGGGGAAGYIRTSMSLMQSQITASPRETVVTGP